MSASLINFESAREKEQQRQFERQARQSILEKAQREYEAREEEQEAARQRGEHTWMLPSVEAKLARDHDASRKKKKKKKDKKKKKKKEKKAKKSKRKESSSSSSDSEDNEDEEGESVWVESSSSAAAPKPSPGQQPAPKVPAPQPAPQESSAGESLKRDGWMEMTSLFGTFSREQMREREGTSRKKAKEEEERKKREAAKPGSHARELNPYYKDGGTGLPEEHPRPSCTSPMATAPQTSGLDAGWLHRALQRAKEQAESQGRTLEEVAAERWGSLGRFNELLAEAEGRGKRRENDARNQSRRRERRSRSRSRERDRIRNRSRSRERDRRRSRSRDRNRGGRRRSSWSKSPERGRDGGKRRSRSRDRNRSRCRSQEREKTRKDQRERSRSAERERRRHGRHSSSSSSGSSRSGSSSRDSSRSSSRNRSKPGDRKDDRGPREDKSAANFSQKLLKPSEELPKSSGLSLRFQKPGEDAGASRSASWSTHRGPSSSSSSSSSNRWQKKEHRQAAKEQQQHQQPDRRPRSSSSSSSSSSSNSDDENLTTTTTTTTATTTSTTSISATATTTTTPKQPPPPGTTAPSTTAPLTDKEMNELAAKIMKAELMGNESQAAKLKSRLEAARAVRAAGSGAALAGKVEPSEQTEQVVVLTRTDSRGISRPVVGAAEAEAGKGKRRTKVKTHGKDGQRARYFPDDDQHSLKNMFEKEKGTTADDQNAMFEKAAMMNPERLNDDYDIDDMFMSKAALRDNAAKQAERDKKKAIQEHQRIERSLETCQWCFDSKEMPKHLIVALGTKCYVSLPAHQSLTPGHCCIVPIHHISCCVQAEEDLWAEVQNFRKSLVKMFSSRGEDCIFFETAKRLRHFPHMVLQCVPLPREMGDMAPIYFKKAIMECEHEWAQNKKLVDLKGRDVRRAVPKGLPYFFVDFAMDAGFAHVIEDEQDFPNHFAQEIVGGMLDLENNLWRKPRRENFEIQRRKVMEFSRWYKEFDPTQEG